MRACDLDQVAKKCCLIQIRDLRYKNEQNINEWAHCNKGSHGTITPGWMANDAVGQEYII